MFQYVLGALNIIQAAKNSCLRLIRGLEFNTLNDKPFSFETELTDVIAENQNTELRGLAAKTLLYTYSAVTLASYGHTPVTTIMSTLAAYDLAQNILQRAQTPNL